ncbi:helix-turn-helix transcriptional regulator [Actinophytocola sp. S1-96]|uniref:Helix-turn-helix transcriptional regulator n=1 Tax=Actinophytocola gossypii TaxID=2812003 RepID=A0ABT2J414_9PSEU|nr:helix-turn-helix transcriptional regulator [Actinophytocola gossypii]
MLAAAAALFAEHGAANVSMEQIAAEAGVGKATLYRRFPDRAAIAVALLDEHERALQDELISGAPPLGPGAAPAERLAAFYAAMVDLLEQHGHLVLGAEVGHRRFDVGAYQFWRTHVLTLLRDAHVERPEVMVELLLAPVAPEVHRHQREALHHTAERVKAALAELAHRVLDRPETDKGT